MDVSLAQNDNWNKAIFNINGGELKYSDPCAW